MPDLVERFRREARAASKIGHPNIVDVTDSGTTADGAFYFVMEYLEGVELGELIERESGSMSGARCMIGAQICRALPAAHEVNVIHRDLKPENVLILRATASGLRQGARLRHRQDAATTGREPGRPAADAARDGDGDARVHGARAGGGPPADARCDVYAVGAILYEMLSGNPPYEGANFMEILHKKANGAPAPLSTVRNDVPPALENVIIKAMAKEPEARQQSMEALEKELQNVATLLFSNFAIAPLSEPDPTPPPSMLGALLRDAASPRSLAERVRGWSGKKVVIAGAAFGLLVAFVVVGATSAARRSGGNAVAVAPTQPPPVAAAPVAPAPPVVPPPALPTVTASPPPVVETKPAEEEEEITEEATEATEAPVKTAGDGESATRTKAATKVVSSSGAEAKKLLIDARAVAAR